MFEVTATRFPRSNVDVCATNRQRRRSLSLKPLKASSATRQRALGGHRLINKLQKKVNIILRRDISKDLSCK